MNFKARKFIAPLFALLLAGYLAGCDIGSNSGDQPTPPGQNPDHSASEMTQTQYADASDGAITVATTTKTLVLKGGAGMTIYMARSNISNTAMNNLYSRLARITSGGVSASAEKSALSFQEEEKEIEAAIVSGFETDLENDPHAKIWKLSMDNVKKAKAQGLISKSLAPGVQAAVKNYAVGDTETFYALNPKTLSNFTQRTFKLLVSEANYNVWVDVNDQYYTQGIAAFTTAAQTMGTNFINGYGLTSHLYGQPSDKIYNADGSVYGPMSTASKTGEKINIMLYDMLTDGKVYGFVYHGDIRHNTTGSNEGRFVYMDSQTTLKNPLEAYSTAQHEFSHTISYNQKTMINKKEWTYWYGELLAMMCEDMMQAYFGISDSDDNDKLGNTPKSRLSTANYNYEWACGLTGQTSATYSAAFHLGAWLVRKFGGPKFIKEIATNAYVDFDSILAAVKATSGKEDYTITSLLQEKAGDLMVRQNNAGFNQDGATYPGEAAYTCAYTDAGGEHTYLYPVTAINLWEPFYGWYDQSKYAENITNTSIPFSQLPNANVYKKADWKGNTPTTAYLGPLQFKGGNSAAQIGPFGSMLFKLGEVTSTSVTIEFSVPKGSAGFSDTITIYAK
ncbi:MAG: hypothetical protein IJL24_00745 [Treponema sp.]|nr:hypothetical protein [Treponema sp.]